MKKIYLLLLLIFSISCEDVIQVEIDSAEPQIVIEAHITNSLNNNFVKITESTEFYNPNTYKTISNAQVVIKENDKTEYLLEEISPGKYQHNQLVTNPGNKYSISIRVKEKLYSAESYTPIGLKIDSVNYQIKDRPFNKEKYLELHVYFQDNPNQQDFARFVIYKNGEKIKKIFIYNDRLTNGNYINYFFFDFNDESFRLGDKIFVEMQSINSQTYKYFRTLKNATAKQAKGPFGSAAPANPTSNWNNNALGYFSTFTVSTSSIVLK
jgi:hypothetical protein